MNDACGICPEGECDDCAECQRLALQHTLVENWASRLEDATKNPTVNWVEVNVVIDAMRSFVRGKR